MPCLISTGEKKGIKEQRIHCVYPSCKQDPSLSFMGSKSNKYYLALEKNPSSGERSWLPVPWAVLGWHLLWGWDCRARRESEGPWGGRGPCQLCFILSCPAPHITPLSEGQLRGRATSDGLPVTWSHRKERACQVRPPGQ